MKSDFTDERIIFRESFMGLVADPVLQYCICHLGDIGERRFVRVADSGGGG